MNEEMRTGPMKYRWRGNPFGRYTAKTLAGCFAGLLITFVVAVGGLLTGAIAYVYSILTGTISCLQPKSAWFSIPFSCD